MITIHVGDVREKLKLLAPRSVQCIATSVPYWALRDYGTGSWSGGKKGCEHAEAVGKPFKCHKCGAKRADDPQIGLEPNIGAWVETMVDVGTALHRVLREDGTMWLNVGDNYSSVRDPEAGLKPKDLCLQAFRMAIGLQKQGWYLRSNVIWYKPGIVPESVTDRPTVTHEYFMMFTKQPTYYYDAEAVRTPTANLRTVWTVAAQGVEGHNAVYPEKLIEPIIKASTSEHGACRKCGAPWGRVGHLDAEYAAAVAATRGGPAGDLASGTAMKDRLKQGTSKARIFHTTGWEPTCAHKRVGDPVPCVVLDPFSGSGTTGVVANWLRRDYVGIELSPKHAAASEIRIRERPKRLFQAQEEKVDNEARLRNLAHHHKDEPGDLGKISRLVLALGGDE